MKHINITKQQLHTFIDKEIDKYKSKKGRAFFYKKPKRLEIVGEKRVMRFDTKDRKSFKLMVQLVKGCTKKVVRELLHQNIIC